MRATAAIGCIPLLAPQGAEPTTLLPRLLWGSSMRFEGGRGTQGRKKRGSDAVLGCSTSPLQKEGSLGRRAAAIVRVYRIDRRGPSAPGGATRRHDRRPDSTRFSVRPTLDRLLSPAADA